ncbi:MAG: hypothetical protein WCA81_08780 [Rhizomicrobium sp.]
MRIAAIGLTLLCVATAVSADDAVERTCRSIYAERPAFVELGLDADGVPIWNGVPVLKKSTLDEYFEKASHQKHVYFYVLSKDVNKPQMKEIVADGKRHGVSFIPSECWVAIP